MPSPAEQPACESAQCSATQRIFSAIVKVVGAHTFPATTLPMVLERAGVEQAEFERCFQGLEDAYCQAYDALISELMERVLAAYDTQLPWRDRLRAAGYASLAYLLEDLNRARFLIVEVRSAGEDALARRDVFFADLVELVDAARQDLEGPESVPRSTAEAVVGAVDGMIIAALERGNTERVDEEKLARELMFTAVRPYLGYAAALEELRKGSPEPRS